MGRAGGKGAETIGAGVGTKSEAEERERWKKRSRSTLSRSLTMTWVIMSREVCGDSDVCFLFISDFYRA